MVTLRRKILVPTVLLGAVVAASVAAVALQSLRDLRTLERDTSAVRSATALAYALEDATQDEDREVLSLRSEPDSMQHARVRARSDRVAELVADVQELSLPPRASVIWADFGDSRAVAIAVRDAALAAAARGDGPALDRQLARWRIAIARTDALLKDFTSFHLRSLERTIAELQLRRARTVTATIVAAVLALLVAAGLAFAVSRAVVQPVVAVAGAAERIADTGRLSAVEGSERGDEIGTLARAFNRMTERLFDANARLEEADRRKDEFLGMLSHELRNPLAPIRSSLAVLERAEPGSAAAVRAREVMKRQVAHVTRLVDDLLDVTRIARGKIELTVERLDLGELVGRSAEDHALTMRERRHDFVVDVPAPGELWVDGDATRLTQVVGNLLQNAAKFTPPGGHVTLSARGDGDAAELRVADDGVGIEAALLAEVFDPFTQATQPLARPDGGLGLGLAVVRGIAQLHGGSVEARSAGRGQGAEFVVRLPRAAAPPAEAASAVAAAAPSGAPRRVLVVDDNTDAAASLAEIVALFGHRADVAHDGNTAIEKVRASPPDIVLCDIGLPGMSGYEVAAAVRALGGPRIRLYAVSGYARAEDVQRAIAAGFDGHLGKPMDPADIQKLLAV